jgi:hypothetical protein
MSKNKDFIEKFLTPRGMAFTILGLTFLSIGIGCYFVFLYKTYAYKTFGIDDAFAQGSGSLIQAIWGSAATIAASILAIILATEALRLTKKTNELTELSNKFQESESVPYQIWLKKQAAILAFDQYAALVKPILGGSNGVITRDNFQNFEFITLDVLEKIREVYTSPLFNMLDQIKLKDVNPHMSETHASALGLTMVYFHSYKSRLEDLTEEKKIDIHNKEGRTIWRYLFDIRSGLVQINLQNIKDFMDPKIKTKWVENNEAEDKSVEYLKSPMDYSTTLQELQKLLKRS